MASDAMSGWQPDWRVPPGEILLEALEERGMTQVELARRTARPLKTINEIIKGKAAITAETAIQLERALGISAGFWTGLEMKFREHLARQEAQLELESSANWLEGFPLKDLVRHKLVSPGKSKAATLEALLHYFRVSSPEAFERQWLDPAAAFRSSPTFMSSPKAVAAWLRWGEIEAEKTIGLSPFDARLFRQVLRQVRPMTRKSPFMQILRRVQVLCAETGVIIILMPEFQGTHLSGATRWVGARPLIQLSLRHKVEDQFWFTLFHEAGHILNSPRRRAFVDAADFESAPDADADEAAANEFARDVLLPPDQYQAFIEAGDLSTTSVRAFARLQEVAPGIVVGRLQREKRVPPSHLNDLKKPLRWSSEIS